MNNDEPIAHVSEDGQMEQETCEIKSKRSVAKFGDEFGCGEWGYLAGL